MPAFPPATAAAVMALLDHYEVPLEGRRAVVVGRSTVVGKPLAHLLLDRHATVTVAHSRTRDLASVTARAEVLVAAAGRAGLIGRDHVAPRRRGHRRRHQPHRRRRPHGRRRRHRRRGRGRRPHPGPRRRRPGHHRPPPPPHRQGRQPPVTSPEPQRTGHVAQVRGGRCPGGVVRALC
ncbi:hypothetical protein [Nonomuraea salmonea]|uniref:hypothetical protein n=1 Tax=Nonomuraea salmonea TaxID=46181 RepID=UPI003CD0B0E3